MELPNQYKFLEKEPGPKMLIEFLKIYGIKETKGGGDNPEILEWSKELGISNYSHDSIPWCGLAMALVAKRAGKPVPKDPLWALNWLNFGTKVPIAKLGYILVFNRPGGHHVGLYIGEDKEYYFVGGGNQGDSTSIVKIPKSRCIGIRQPIYHTKEPDNVRVIQLNTDGIISHNES